jgi:amino acid adenylation domain-containing protein/FkbM family methyltransferase
METTLQGFRLSLQQRRAWQTQQDGTVCGCQCLVRMTGPLDVPALSAALAEVVRRHEILRTAFRRVPGLKVPVQVVDDVGTPLLDRIDLGYCQAAEQEAEIDCLLELDRRRPFELGNGRPIRAALIQLGEGEHRLLLTLPPVCSDSATLSNLVREIARAYAECLGAAEPGVDSMQYIDFSEWQNDWLAGEEVEEGKDYWRRWGLSGLIDLALPGEDPTHSPVFDCEALSLALSADEVRAARALAGRHETSPRVIFLGVWQALLARLSGDSGVTVGVVCDGRSYAEIEGTLGLFARTLPVRYDLAGLRFREILTRTAVALGEAEAWQDYFVADELLPSAQDGESLGFLPFAFECEERPEELVAGGLRFSVDRQFGFAERFKLRLVCSLAGEEGRAALQYDPQRYGREQIVRIAGHWRRLLLALLANPEREPADVDILDEAESRLLLDEWNRTAAPFPEVGIHQLIEARAAERPEAPALLCGGRVVTYAELDGRADRLARSLVDLGVRPGMVVGILADRSPEMVVGLLAVLKAGGAYVALDPEQPRARLLHLLEETAPVVLLAPRALAGSLPAHTARVVHLDDDPAPSSTDLPAADPRRLAYVVFTSGSTGWPKGVLIPHRGVVNYLTFLRTAYGLGESDIVLQIPDLTFDSSVRDLLGPLAAGARVVLVEKDLAKDPFTLLRKVRENGVTCLLSVVPTMLRALLDAAAGEPAPHDSVRLLLASGEVLRASDGAGVERVFGSGARLFNQYGPTECTMTSSFYPVPGGLNEGDATALPIGRPIPNARFYLLDDRMLPVPVGAPGELYIGGAGVASGYLNVPALTTERFVQNPFAAEPGARLYRTGDLAVYRPDGVLEFRGRADQQLKLRGVRVEPEEIEVALLDHPAVQRAVVIPREDTSGDVRLAAYVVPNRRPAVELSEEERYVLPNQMLIAQQNRYETDFFYEQIFVDKVELRHGVTLADGDVVFDVGANIGLFSLFVHMVCRNPRVYSFEPIPEIFATLSTNMELYGLGAKLFNCGLSDQEGSVQFSYYPHSSCQSGYYADASQETRMLHGIIARQKPGAGADESRYVEELVAERMESRAVLCPLKTVSQVLRENGLDRIDLLKIDTEKAELDVLRGVRDEDWPKIRQIVIEGHDLEGRLAQLVSLLESQGFEVVVEKDEMLEETCLFNVYGFRDRRPAEARSYRQQPQSERLPLASSELLSGEELRHFLRMRLPEVMVPSSFVILDSLPTTPNGKVDRRSLPAPEPLEAVREEAHRDARTPTEEIIAGIWAGVLKTERIDVREDFFALGGHSLLGTQAILRVNETFQISIPLRMLFDMPTVEGLARVVDEAVLSRQGLTAQPLRPAPRTGEIPLSFAQQRLWFVDQLQPGNSMFNLASAVRLTGRLDLSLLQRTLDEVVRRHESLRTTFAATGKGPVQVIAPPAPVPLPITDLSTWGAAEREAELDRLLAQESRRSFDLASGPLLRVVVVRMSETEHVVHLNMHHIVGDAWSTAVLTREFTALFEAFSRGAASPLPELPVQYADFAIWQRDILQGEILEAHLDFWKRQLAGAPALLALSLDRSRPAVASFHGARHLAEMPMDLAGQLAALGRSRGATMFMTLLAALQVTLRFLGAGDDIVIGTDVANRTRPEVEVLIGFFINQLVLRTDLTGDPSFSGLLARVRRTAMDAYSHQDLPFDKLVEVLRPERSLNHAPLFQVKLVFQNTPRAALELPSGLAIGWIPVESAPAREDLLLNAAETGQGLLVTFKYNADLFDASTIERMAGLFERVLRRVAVEPEARLSDLDEMLAETDRESRASQAQEHASVLEQKLKTIRLRAASR